MIDSNHLAINLAKRGVFLDIGCSEGCYLERMAARALNVYAFEPLPRNIDMIHLLMVEKMLKNVLVYECALGAEENQETKFYLNGSGSSSIATSWREQADKAGYAEDNYIIVKTIPLDSLELTGVTFAKIDVERAEQFVLKGGEKTFSTNKMLIALETHRGVDCEKIMQHLTEWDYKVWKEGELVTTIEVDTGYICSNDPDIQITKEHFQ